MQRRTGEYVPAIAGGQSVRAFVPFPLPPSPPLDLNPLLSLVDRASTALGRLDGATAALPSRAFFLFMYVRKEALLSSQIEGTQSSLSDLLLFEIDEVPRVPLEDVMEVSNYVAAAEHGIDRLRSGFPLSLRLIRELHEILLRSGRGAGKQAGEFRRTQNWIGGHRPANAIFIPPPPERLSSCLDAFERFLHAANPALPPLIRAGLAHVQFESVHPFLDGNGRIGRLLIALILADARVLTEPVLFLSLFFKRRRSDYYRLLQEVREHGNWEGWIEFFLLGVAETAEQACETVRQLTSLVESDRAAIGDFGRAAVSALRLHDFLQHRPLTSIRVAAQALGLSAPTVTKALERMVGAGIVNETTGGRRNRLFAYARYLRLLEQGTDPLPAPAR